MQDRHGRWEPVTRGIAAQKTTPWAEASVVGTRTGISRRMSMRTELSMGRNSNWLIGRLVDWFLWIQLIWMSQTKRVVQDLLHDAWKARTFNLPIYPSATEPVSVSDFLSLTPTMNKPAGWECQLLDVILRDDIWTLEVGTNSCPSQKGWCGYPSR